MRRSQEMKPIKIVGLVLVALGVLALVYGGFSYTEESHDLELGRLELQVAEKDRVNVPLWLGVAAVAVGTLLLVVPRTA
jgi:hypothetical protein